MNTLVLHISRENGWSPEDWLLSTGGSRGMADQVVLETETGWLAVGKCDEVMHDYEDSELQVLESLIRDPVPYLVEWRGNHLVQQLVDAIPLGCSAAIDNDHGLICLVDRVKNLPVTSWIAALRLD
jgi:hypothetical protein